MSPVVSSSSALSVWQFGRFEVHREDRLIRPSDWGRRKVQTLLKVLLTARGQVFSQDRLVDALFPELSPDKAKHNLQARVAELRRILEGDAQKKAGPRYVLTVGDGYCFGTEAPCWIDTEEFGKLVQAGRLAEGDALWSDAVARYREACEVRRGEYLTENLYEEWSLDKREQLREAYLDALGRLASCHVELGQYELAVETCRRLLNEDPRQETACRLLMCCYAWLGERGKASQAFDSCRQALAEIGVAPSDETAATFEQIRSGTLAEPRRATARESTRELGTEAIELRGLSPSSGAHGIPGNSAGTECRIAVLPLRNISPHPGDAYFADGMTEELIYTLSRISRFRVIAQASAMLYRDSPKSAMQIGKELGVGNLLEGSVRKAGDRVRITVQLVDVVTEEHVWSQSYDRRIEDIFEIQTDIAEHVVAALRVRLLSADEAQITQRPSVSAEAYTAFLRGRLSWSRRTAEGLNRSVGLFRKAIDLAPDYALAHAGLANSLVLLPGYVSSVAGSVVYPQARDAAMRAMAIDDSLADPHAALGLVKSHFEWEPDTAEREFLKALALQPGSATAHHWYGISLTFWRRFAEAERELRTAASIDPLSLVVNADLGQLFYYSRHNRQAVAQLQETLEIDPEFIYARICLTLACLQEGDTARAGEHLGRVAATTLDEDTWSGLALGVLLVSTGRRDEVSEILGRLIRRKEDAYVSPCRTAFLHLALGEFDEGLADLHEAYEDRDSSLIYVLMEPVFDPLRSHPVAISLARRMHAESWTGPDGIPGPSH